MIKTYNSLMELIRAGVITGEEDLVNAASIDVRLGNVLKIEVKSHKPIDLAKKENIPMATMELKDDEPFVLMPGQFILAETKEFFNLPNNLASIIFLKSSGARNGLNHLHAGWCDPGWHGSTLTMELTNVCQLNELIIRPNMKVGQMVFLEGEPVPDEHSYAAKGQYNNQKGAQQSKGIR